MRTIEWLLWRLARAALPRTEREWMTGDLEEEHARVAAARGRGAATRWLAGETLRNIGAAAALRRPRPKGTAFMRNSLRTSDTRSGCWSDRLASRSSLR